MGKKGNRLYFYLWIVLVLGLSASVVIADDFSGTSSGIFQNPVGPVDMVTTGVGTNTFTWGTGFPTSSSLSFTGASFSGFLETEFSFGTLNYYNGTIVSGSGAEGIDLLANLTLTVPPGVVVSNDFSFTFQLINTLNTGNPEESADIVKLGTAFDPTTSFVIGGTEYFLQFTRFGSVSPGGFITGIDQFHVLEEASASAQLFGKLTSEPVNPTVPEPATMLLLGSGLIGLAGYGRKKLFRK